MASVPNMRPAPVLATTGAAPTPEGAAAIDFTSILSQVPAEALLSGPGLSGGQPTVDVAPADGALQPASKKEAMGEEAVDENAPIVIAEQIADLVPIVLAQGGQPVAATIPMRAKSIAAVPTGSAPTTVAATRPAPTTVVAARPAPATGDATEPAPATGVATGPAPAEPAVATAAAAAASGRAALPGSVAPTNLPARAPAEVLLPAANDPASAVQGTEAARTDPRRAAPIVSTPPPVVMPQKPHARGEPAVASKSPGSRPFTIVPPPPPGARAAAPDGPMPPLPVAKPRQVAGAMMAGTAVRQADVAKSPAPRRTVEVLRASPERVADAPPLAIAKGAAAGIVVEGEGKRPAPAKAAAARVAAEVQAQSQPVAVEAPATASAPQAPAAVVPPAATLLAAAPLSAPGQAATAAPGQEPGIERELDLAREGEWLDRLARDIVRAGANDGAMRFRLNPQTLGHLQVELAQGDHGTSIRLSVETEAARAILVDAQPRLLAEARAQGVRIADSEVDLAGSGHQPGSDARRQADGPQTPFIRTSRGTGSDSAQTAAADAAPPRSDRYA